MKRLGLSILKLIAIAVVTLLLLDVVLYLIGQTLDGQAILYPIIALWAVLAYIILPRIHRLLTRIYIPDYYIGRTRTGDGFLGDPVNLAFIGPEDALHKAMTEAGWTRADDLDLKSSLKMVRASVTKRSYKRAPVSSLFLFSRKQDFAYQQEINGNPRARHHIRFWRTPKKWWLPGGHEADWLAAATFDRSVGFSLYTGQITHKVDDDIDIERDYVLKTVSGTEHVETVEVVEHFSTAYHSRNGGGDKIKTDGSLPFIRLK